MRQAIKAYERSFALNPDNYRALERIGVIHLRNGAIGEAIRYLEKANEMAPCAQSLYVNHAQCYFAQKNPQRALSILESYSEQCPRPSPTINTFLGKIYMDLFEDWEKAKRCLEEAVRRPSRKRIPSETFRRLGTCYFHLRDPVKARETWEEGLRIYPDDRAMREKLLLLD